MKISFIPYFLLYENNYLSLVLTDDDDVTIDPTHNERETLV